MSLSIGVIYVAYQAEDQIGRSLTPWTAARSAKLGGHSYTICAVSVPFEGFDHGGTQLDATHGLLRDVLAEGHIDCLIADEPPVPLKETEARGQALQWLVAQGVDITIMVDADEVYCREDIHGVLGYVSLHPLVSWFRLSLVNLVFHERQRLAEPFTPPRIHRVAAGGYRAAGFWDDNNVFYRSQQYPDHIKRDVDLASLTIPESIAAPRHYTWLNDERSQRKIAYQHRRWGHSSYCWDEAQGGLCFDTSYYAKFGLPLPVVTDL